ncbi:N-acetylglucosamine-6-phosphate deacetylase [Aphanomyces invadans]|uniref:N-acetylglucosamine-6-phosphate deacetylase n=1 Tax=Aphanomyces invadans TaxID=157072 RepID=A0A024UAR9_9STRA|nr:N-acetylglucosamine-6-phosphate deacetylase [Aphanomyces invadans]ETW02733.1 N-acetylglucosamine-6-phosphate deacetylase [Aphanomyces invadans]|eukprot:XP_008868117.1 N-acetylglucosamine-6-phosphate deacetylase [Aphanomyces invadans]
MIHNTIVRWRSSHAALSLTLLTSVSATRTYVMSRLLHDTTLKIENVRVLRDGVLVNTFLWVENGKIMDPQARYWKATSSLEYGPGTVVDGKGMIVAPGFIDIQLNGAFGHDFSDIDCTPEQILEVRQKLLATGVTAFCPTVISSAQDSYAKVLHKFERTNDGHVVHGANMVGLHLEGPFINKQRKGAHKEDVLVDPEEGIKSLEERYGAQFLTRDRVALVTLAPELKGALPAIAELKQRGITVSAGHSSANIEQAIAGVNAGVSMLTHLFNAMASFHHRDPGLVGLLGVTEHRPYYGLILDGIHSHHSSCRIAQSSHPQGLILVTDCMAGMGLPDGSYELAGLQVDVKGGRAYLQNTTTIAGSVVQMDSCIRTLIEFTDCSVEYALMAATLHPAQSLGLTTKGTLNFGADADFVLLNDKLQVIQTYIAGTLVYERPESDDVVLPTIKKLLRDFPVAMTHFDFDDDRAMDKAAASGQLVLVQQMHEQGRRCTVHAMDGAAANGHLDVVKFLHTARNEGCTTNAIDVAASNGHVDIVHFLTENRTEGRTNYAWKAANEHGHHDVIAYLLQHGQND